MEFELVKRIVDKADIAGLLEYGAPSDEYDLESRLIAEGVKAGMSFREVHSVVDEVFEDMFGEFYESFCSLDEIKKTAQEIYAALNAQN